MLHMNYRDVFECYWDSPSPKTVRRYYQGFNRNKRNHMFADELKDLEVIYRKKEEQIVKEVTECLPYLIHYMDKFVTLHKQNEDLRDKLECLLEKTGENKEQYEGEDDE